MIPPISDRDLTLLSASLDGALSARASAQLDQRLAAEPALSAALKQLQQTRVMLRRTPQRRVPHAFTLTPEMLGKPSHVGGGGWNSLSIVSAVASLLLVLVLIGDFSINGLPFMFGAAAPAAEEAPQAFMAQEAPATGEEAFDTLTLPPEEDLAGADERQMKDESQFDLRTFVSQNARPLEIGLGLIIAASVLTAWLQKRRG